MGIHTYIPANEVALGFLRRSNISFRSLIITRLADGRGVGTVDGVILGWVDDVDIGL